MGESPGALAVRERQALSGDFGTTLTGAQLKFIANTEFVPKAYRGNLPAIAACVATGRALGLADMNSLRAIHVIDGKAAFSAELMVQLVRKAGHSIQGDITDKQATARGKRADNGDEMAVTFTMEMAERAGLANRGPWKAYPEAMLWARAVSSLCRMLFADCFAGASYTPEELGQGDVTADELMDEPAQSGGGVEARGPQPEPASPPEHVEDGEFEDVTPGPISQEQKDRLLELVAASSVPDIGGKLTAKLKADYKARSYNDLNSAQLDELLAWLEEQK